MCHHHNLANEQLYEAAQAREKLPDWRNNRPESEAEPDESDDIEKTLIAPSVADD